MLVVLKAAAVSLQQAKVLGFLVRLDFGIQLLPSVGSKTYQRNMLETRRRIEDVGAMRQQTATWGR